MAPTRSARGPADGTRQFQLTVAALVAVLVIVPYVTIRYIGLDGRTPLSIAQDALHDKYGLVLVDTKGAPVPEDSSLPTVSEFSLETGATTKKVRFLLEGRPVLCTIHVPDGNPKSVTATCEPDEAAN